MYILETEQSFDSAHFLSGYKGKCSNLHGHRWRVVARIAMDELNKEGQTRDMVIDFGDFKDALKKLTDALDHSFIFETGSLKETTVIALKEEGFYFMKFLSVQPPSNFPAIFMNNYRIWTSLYITFLYMKLQQTVLLIRRHLYDYLSCS